MYTISSSPNKTNAFYQVLVKQSMLDKDRCPDGPAREYDSGRTGFREKCCLYLLSKPGGHQIKKMRYTYTLEYYSAIKRE